MFWSVEKKCFFSRRFCLLFALSLILLLFSGTTGFGTEREGVQHYKMISSIEYSGKGQFKSRVESLFTVSKEALSDDKVLYTFSGNNLTPNQDQESAPMEFSFVIDKDTRYLSGADKDMAFWERVNNESVKSLKKVTKYNVGKTWKQTINLSFLGSSLPRKLNFTLTAMELKADVFGKMIAVRALSEPFMVKTGKDSLRSNIKTIYLFDPQIEDIYLSISVFETAKSTGGVQEILHHEVATYKTNATGSSVDLKGLGPKFEKFVREVGLRKESIKIVKKSLLPQWALSEGLTAAQVANVCAAMACEGALNPVVTVCIPAAWTVKMQSLGKISSISAFPTTMTVARSLGQSVPGIGTMKIAVAPAWVAQGLITAQTVTAAAGATAGGLIIANNSGHDHDRSPVAP